MVSRLLKFMVSKPERSGANSGLAPLAESNDTCRTDRAALEGASLPQERRYDMTRGLSRAAAREAGLAPPKLGLKVVTSGQGGACRIVFTFAGMQVLDTDALA